MVKSIVDFRSSLEILLSLFISVLALIVLPTNHWGQFYRQSPIDIIYEDGRYGLWTLCFVEAPRYIEDCESEAVEFKLHRKAFVAGILCLLHLVVVAMLYLPVRIISTMIRNRTKPSGCFSDIDDHKFMFFKFGCSFIAGCLALAVAIMMSNATDAPQDYKLERDWCYYVQFVILAADVILFGLAAKELVDKIDQDNSGESQLRRKEVSAPTTTAPMMPDIEPSITNIDDFTVYSTGTVATKEGLYQPLKNQQQQQQQHQMQSSPKPTEVVHYVNEGVRVSQADVASIVSDTMTGRRPHSNLIEMSPSPEMNFFDESVIADGRASFVSPGPPSEEGSESQFGMSPIPGGESVSPGIPPPPPPPPPPGAAAATTQPTHDYQVPASQPVPTKPPSQDGLPKGPFGFVLPPLKFQPKNYDEDSLVGYKIPRGQDNEAFEKQEERETNEQRAFSSSGPSAASPIAASTPAPPTGGGNPPPPPPPPPPAGWQPGK